MRPLGSRSPLDLCERIAVGLNRRKKGPRMSSLGRRVVIAACLLFLIGAGSAFARARTLHVTRTDGGVVTSSDGKIDCGADCSARYARRRGTELNAVPSTDFQFSNWTGGCVGLTETCAVALGATTTVNAAFKRVQRVVRLSVGGPGTVTSDPAALQCGASATTCAATLGQGTTTRLIATPAADGVFDSWLGRPCEGDTSPTCVVAVGANTGQAVSAVFRHANPQSTAQPLTVSVTGGRVTSDPPGIDCSGTCTAMFAPGTHVTLRTGGGNANWQGGCTGSLPDCTLVIDAAITVSADIPPIVVPRLLIGINVNVTGPGVVSGGFSFRSTQLRCGGRRGSLLDCEDFFADGATVKLKAKPGRGARFRRWKYFCSGKKKKCTVAVTAPKTVGAVFRR
jgi:trimeric autotransporter adhesin